MTTNYQIHHYNKQRVVILLFLSPLLAIILGYFIYKHFPLIAAFNISVMFMFVFFYRLHRFLASSKLEFIMSDDLITVVCKTPFLGSKSEPTLMFSIHELSAVNSNSGFKFGSLEFIHKSGKNNKFITSTFNRNDQTHLLIAAIENSIPKFNQHLDKPEQITYSHKSLKQPILSFIIPSLVVVFIVINQVLVNLSDIEKDRWVIFSVIYVPILLSYLNMIMRNRRIRKMDKK